MGDQLTPLHAQCKRLIISLNEGLKRLEETEAGGVSNGREDTVQSMAKALRQQYNELHRTSNELDSTWRMHVVRENYSRREVWKRNVERVAEAVDSIRSSLDRYGTREQRRAAERADRDELFARASQGRQVKSEMDEEAQALSSVQRSKRYVEEIYESGTHILAGMAGNRERLKRAHKKALDVLTSVGMGDFLLRMIERRQRMDIYIAYGGMAFLLVVAIVLVVWVWSS